jgi:iron-sulfur cluster repair protein YtfE (RIC family)
MKRCKALQNLSRDHHQSLLLAQKAIQLGQSNHSAKICELGGQIVNDFDRIWKKHFQQEEETIFILFSYVDSNNAELQQLASLCQQLQQEHVIMTEYYQQMKQGNYQCLEEFGLLLKQHTRMEERQLFPLLEKKMTVEQLDTIYRATQ